MIFGIILMVFTRNDFNYIHKRCALFSISLFIALLAVSAAMIIYYPPFSVGVDLARFISSFGIILVLVTLVYGLETNLGKNLCFATIFSSFLAHGLVFINRYIADFFSFIALLLVFIIYFLAYKNVDVLRSQLTKGK